MSRVFECCPDRFNRLRIGERTLQKFAIPAEDFRDAIAGDCRERRVRRENQSVRIGDNYPLRDRLERQVAHLQVLFGFSAFGNVFVDNHNPAVAVHSKTGHSNNEPSLFLRAVAWIFEAKLIGLPRHHRPYSTRNSRSLLRVPAPTPFTNTQVVGPDIQTRGALRIALSKASPCIVHLDDSSRFVQNRDVSR